jgi:hypothetical protein
MLTAIQIWVLTAFSLVPMTSLKDVDTALAHKKDFLAALGDQGKT